MKNLFLNSITALLLSSLIYSCSTDDGIKIPGNQDTQGCDYSEILFLSKEIEGDDVSFYKNDLDASTTASAIFQDDITAGTPLSYELASNFSIYNSDLHIYSNFISRAGAYLVYDNNTNQASYLGITPSQIAAPVFVNNTNYSLNFTSIPQDPYLGGAASFKIETFNILDASITGELTLDPNDLNINVNSPFHIERLSSATNGVDEIYFITGTNLLVINILTEEVNYFDLDPSFDWSNNYNVFIGLEYDEDLGLIAIRHTSGSTNNKIVSINKTNGNLSNLIDISIANNSTYEINSEFYSTTYNPCDKTYYLTSYANTNGPLGDTRYFEFDLDNLVLKNYEFLNEYKFGLQILP